MSTIRAPSAIKPTPNQIPTHIRILSQLQIGKLLLSLPSSTLRQFEKQKINSYEDIKSLYLCRKNLDEIPELDELVNLRVLWLNGNAIKDIGSRLRNMSNLQQIYLTNNQIDQLKGLEKCAKLLKLNLAYNNICTIPTNIALPMTLKYLLLSRNQITTIEPLSYLDLHSLEYLYLSGNLITSAVTLRHLCCPHLKYLYLDNNKISDYWMMDEIYLQPGGQATLVNLQYTLDEPVTTIMKLGQILSARARYKGAGIVFK